jgi:pilus assembly protein Flp/PilA
MHHRPISDKDGRQRGASAVEYGLLISGVAVIIVTAVFLFGGAVSKLFSGTCSTVGAQASPTSTCS